MFLHVLVDRTQKRDVLDKNNLKFLKYVTIDSKSITEYRLFSTR